MRKMNEKAMKVVNGGYQCVIPCGRKFKTLFFYTIHLENCVYGKRFLNEMYGRI